MAKADLQALLRKAERMKEVPQTKIIEVSGMELEIRRLPADKFYDLKMGFGRYIDDGKKMLEVQTEAVYDAVPLLHDKQLQEACECADPLDVVGKVFNADELLDIATALLDFDGNLDDGDPVDGLKN